MLADDCFRLGAVAYFNQDYYHTVMWITEALNVWQTEQTKTIDKATLLDYLSYSLYTVSQFHANPLARFTDIVIRFILVCHNTKDHHMTKVRMLKDHLFLFFFSFLSY